MRPVALLLPALLTLLPGCGGEAARPDVVLVLIDTLRADRTTVLDPDVATTPHLSTLQPRGTTYVQAIAPSSWTLPSMAGLFAGKDVVNNRYRAFPDEPSLAERFREAGYRTVAVVANPLVSEKGDFARGFDHWEVAPEPLSNEELIERLDELRAEWNAEAVTRRAIALLEGPGDDRPVFLYVHVMDPHIPYDEDNFLRAPLDPGWSTGTGPGEPPEVAWTDRLTAEQEQELSTVRRGYDGQVHFVDEALSALLEHLAGRSRPYYLGVTSDHGEGLLSHRRNADERPKARVTGVAFLTHGMQRTEEQIRVPLWLVGPGVPEGRRELRQVRMRDLGATLLHLADIPAPDERLPLADGDATPDVIFGADRRGWFVRTAERKLIMPYPRRAERPGVTARVFAVEAERYAPEKQDLRATEAEASRELGRWLQEWIRDNPQDEGGAEMPVDETTLEHMRQLGYLR